MHIYVGQTGLFTCLFWIPKDVLLLLNTTKRTDRNMNTKINVYFCFTVHVSVLSQMFLYYYFQENEFNVPFGL